ncbi:hypothetical protein PIB30_038559 [Stylosanthes scabra]|uniref:Uncharacterized protein n=1 Tax=Stylosanthes scabra TaxID=79078 RepID=A0ABU6YEB3_9FABA|nr:hypothetical protein [Stylosanthes scabra]
MFQDFLHSPAYGPMRAYSPPNIAKWDIRMGEGVPYDDTSENSVTWVISWLHLKGHFSSRVISGVLEDHNIRARTAISLAEGSYNDYGSWTRDFAARWHRELSK